MTAKRKGYNTRRRALDPTATTIAAAQQDLAYVEEHLISADRWMMHAADSFYAVGNTAVLDALGQARMALSRVRTQVGTIQQVAWRGATGDTRDGGGASTTA